MKTCTKCNHTKTIDNFTKDKSKKDGYRPDCKECKNTANTLYHRTKKGIVTSMYGSQKNASKVRGYNMPNYTKEELREWLYSQELFHELFNRWESSNYDKNLTPSCDRHNDKGDYDYLPYSLDLLRLCTWEENYDKSHKDRKIGVNNKCNKAVSKYSQDHVFITTYHSIKYAARENGTHDSNIISCIQGKKSHAGGFIWEYGS